MQNNFNNKNPNNPLKEALLSCKVMIKFVLLFGCLINLLMLSTPLFSMQVLDRVIKDTKSKLLFILMYVKFYPTYDLAGALFGVVASRPHEWVNEYLPILEEALGRHCVLPARKITSAEEFKRLYPGVQEVILDGAERPIQRPKNNKNQKKAYSGKKKRHTRKNIYLVNKEKKILYLSPTKAGKIHDFKQFKKTAVILITLNKLINISPFSITSFSNLSLCLNKIIPSFYTSVNYFITSFKNSILQKSTFYCLPSVFTTV